MSNKLKYFLIFLVAIAVGGGLIGLIVQTRLAKANSPVIEVTVDNFKKEVGESKIPVYIEFYVDKDCPPCEKQAPVIEKLAAEYAGKVKFVRINALKQMPISQSIGIEAVPTHVLVNPATGTGVVAEGYLDEATLRKFIDQGLAPPAQPTPQPSPTPAPQPSPTPAPQPNPSGN